MQQFYRRRISRRNDFTSTIQIVGATANCVRKLEAYLHDPVLNIPLRTVSDTTGEVQRLMKKLEASGNLLRVRRLLANSPSTFRPSLLLAAALMKDAPLPPKVRELMILHVAARRKVNYEWEEHVVISRRCGVTDDERKALAEGNLHHLAVFSYVEALGLRVADTILTDGALPETMWEEAVALWGVEGALDLIIAVAFWGAYMPTIIEAIGLHSPLPTTAQ